MYSSELRYFFRSPYFFTVVCCLLILLLITQEVMASGNIMSAEAKLDMLKRQTEYKQPIPLPICILYYIVAAALCLFSPMWGFMMLIGSYLLRFQDRYPAELEAIPSFTLLILLLFIGAIVNKDKLDTEYKYKEDKVLLGFLCWVALGLIFMATSLLISEMKNFIYALAFYFFITRTVHHKQDILKFMLFMPVVTSLMGVEALYSYFMDAQTPFSSSVSETGEKSRLMGFGFYDNPNIFGSLMVFSIPFAMCFVLLPRNILIRLVGLGLVGIMGFVVIKSGSRTCMVSMALSLAIIVALQGKGAVIKKGIILGVFLVVGVIGASFIPGPIGDRIRSIGEGGESIEGRYRAWGHGFDMVSWYPSFGVGKNQWLEHHGLAPHNSFVQIMAESGYIGIALFMATIILAFKGLIFLAESKDDPNQPSDKELRQISICVVSSFIVYLLYIFFGNQGWSPWCYFYIGFCSVCGKLVAQDLMEKRALAQMSVGKAPNQSVGKNLPIDPSSENTSASKVPLFNQKQEGVVLADGAKRLTRNGKIRLAPGAEKLMAGLDKK